MCGFGIDLIFKVAIFVIVLLVIIALLRFVVGSWFVGLGATPYWPIIQIVIGDVVAILILLFIWKLAECAGLMGRMGDLGPGLMLRLARLT
jgi:hypothetical protein